MRLACSDYFLLLYFKTSGIAENVLNHPVSGLQLRLVQFVFLLQ